MKAVERASELATAQRNVETQVVQSNKTANDAAQLKKADDTAASELRRERERAEALASELANVRREVETAAAVASQKDDEAVQQKQTAEAAIADLQQLLQQEQKKTAALTQEVGAARQAIGDCGLAVQVDHAVRDVAEPVSLARHHSPAEMERTGIDAECEHTTHIARLAANGKESV